MYAVIKTGGKQYKVGVGDVIKVEKLAGEEGDAITFDSVLAVGEGDGITVGTPVLDGAAVAAEVVEQLRDRKIIVFKKKRRHNYRRTHGHRQQLTAVRITGIAASGGASAATKSAAVSEKKADKVAVSAAAESAPKSEGDAEVAGVRPDLLGAPNGTADDLKKISGVGPKLEGMLNELGIYHFQQIADLSPENVAWVDQHLNFRGRIDRENWIEQAKTLAAGEETEFSARKGEKTESDEG